MQKATSLDTSKITLVKGSELPDGTSFYDLKYEGKPLVLFCYGKVEEEVVKNTNFGERYTFKFKPPVEDYQGLGELDTFVSSDLEVYKERLDTEDLGVHKSLFGSDFVLTIKLTQRKNGNFKFSSNVKLTKENLSEFIIQDSPVSVAGAVGLFVKPNTQEKSGSYGIYFSLTDIQFEKDEKKPKIAARKSK
jgi:hypothetical protein